MEAQAWVLGAGGEPKYGCLGPVGRRSTGAWDSWGAQVWVLGIGGEPKVTKMSSLLWYKNKHSKSRFNLPHALQQKPPRADRLPNYDVRSDVWSFGISMMEIAEGKFPYKLWATPFEQLRQVIWR